MHDFQGETTYKGDEMIEDYHYNPRENLIKYYVWSSLQPAHLSWVLNVWGKYSNHEIQMLKMDCSQYDLVVKIRMARQEHDKLWLRFQKGGVPALPTHTGDILIW